MGRLHFAAGMHFVPMDEHKDPKMIIELESLGFMNSGKDIKPSWAWRNYIPYSTGTVQYTTHYGYTPSHCGPFGYKAGMGVTGHNEKGELCPKIVTTFN